MLGEMPGAGETERIWRADDVIKPEIVKSLGRVCEACESIRSAHATTLVMFREVGRKPAGPALETLQLLACRHVATEVVV